MTYRGKERGREREVSLSLLPVFSLSLFLALSLCPSLSLSFSSIFASSSIPTHIITIPPPSSDFFFKFITPIPPQPPKNCAEES